MWTNSKKSQLQSLGPRSPRPFCPSSTPDSANPGATCLKSTPRAEAASERGRGLGLLEWRGWERRRLPGLPWQYKEESQDGGIYMVMIIAFANCIYCADLPASPVLHSESLSRSQNFPKQCYRLPIYFCLLSQSPGSVTRMLPLPRHWGRLWWLCKVLEIL